MTIELIIPALVFAAVVLVGSGFLLTRGYRQKLIHARLAGQPTTTGQAIDTQVTPGTPLLMRLMQHIGLAYVPGEPSHTLREQLACAGYYSSASSAVYMGAKLSMFILGVAVLSLAALPMSIPGTSKMVIIGVGGGLFFMLPNLYLKSRMRSRTTVIRQHLPDATDLLDICVSTGMGLDMAWNCVADEIRRVCPILADEMALTNLEMHLGAPRANAMRHMAQRTGATELQSLVSILVQSQRFGTSISEALRSFATMMREARSNRASEAAEKLAIKLIFPLVVFIFPSILIVAAGPAGIKIAELFGGD